MNIPSDLVYTKEHEWIRVSGNVGVVGITDHAQSQLGDVTFVELPAVGKKLESGQTIGVVESVKTVSDIYAPVSGEVIEVNQALVKSPEKVNQDPYGDAWMIKIKLSKPNEVSGLLKSPDYKKIVEGS